MDRLFDNEWVLRGLALVLAIVLWVQASLYFITIGPDTIRHVVLSVSDVPTGFVARAHVRQVEVTVDAPSTISRLMPSEFLATVTPTRAKAGVQSLPVMVQVPRGTRLKIVSPDYVQVRLVPAANARITSPA